MKIAVVTSFPYDYWNLCAGKCLYTFSQYWPKEVDLYVQLDNLPEEPYNVLHAAIGNAIHADREHFIGNDFDPDQQEFLDRTPADDKANYRLQARRFSYKVFALSSVARHCFENGYDYVVWLDADVVTNRAISMEKLQEWLPKSGEVVSYLGRTDAPHSECGFVAYDLRHGFPYIEKMRSFYTSDAYKELPGWTDCDVFDHVFKDLPKNNLSEGLPGTHVWPLTDLGQYMEHFKGNRKLIASDNKPQTPPVKQEAKKNGIAIENMEIKTKNCVEHDVIRAQISENLLQIRKWVDTCQYNDEEIVVCSAGDSLNPDDLRPFVERGVKIVAVKHAIERLKEWGIKPWACVLLDPRPHVEKFVQAPDKDVLYFVASMVHPSVVKTLNDNKCKVIGYHAFVNAGESEVLRPGDYLVSGGSATATRCIGLLADCLGFRKFHLFGYDLCHFAKPEKQETLDDGNPKYIEVTLAEPTWGNKVARRTFWSEGQFLAQSKELADLYKNEKQLNITVYGDGIGGWSYRHNKLYNQWAAEFRSNMNKRRENIPNVNDWVRSNT